MKFRLASYSVTIHKGLEVLSRQETLSVLLGDGTSEVLFDVIYSEQTQKIRLRFRSYCDTKPSIGLELYCPVSIAQYLTSLVVICLVFSFQGGTKLTRTRLHNHNSEIDGLTVTNAHAQIFAKTGDDACVLFRVSSK